MSRDDTKLTTKRPGATTKRADVERATRDLTTDEKKKRVLADLPPSYSRRLQALKMNSDNNVSQHDFIREALDRIFEEYARGNGRYRMANVEALARQLKDLE